MTDINYINLYNSFTAQARSAIQEEIKQSQQLTFKTIASITALCVAVVLKDTPDSKSSVVKTKSITVSESKLRNVIIESLYPNIKERKQLNTSEGRPIYNKIRAALILFNKESKKLFRLWYSCYNTKVESSSLEEFTAGVLAIVESYKSLTKILDIAKKKQDSKANTDNESESDSESAQATQTQAPESVSNKSLYNKISTDLTHVVNLLEKAESLDGETLQMVLAGVAKISEVIKAKTQAKTQAKKATKKATKKAA